MGSEVEGHTNGRVEAVVVSIVGDDVWRVLGER